MLKTIPPALSPLLLKRLAEMGHGDELVLGDGNFPAASNARRLLNYNSSLMLPLLEDILKLFPLDTFVAQPVALMRPESGPLPEIWKSYEALLQKYEVKAFAKGFEQMERAAFYQRAQKAYCIVQTGETAAFANLILKKGVV